MQIFSFLILADSREKKNPRSGVNLTRDSRIRITVVPPVSVDKTGEENPSDGEFSARTLVYFAHFYGSFIANEYAECRLKRVAKNYRVSAVPA